MLAEILSGAALGVGLVIWFQLRRGKSPAGPLLTKLELIDRELRDIGRGHERVERLARDELARGRSESLTASHELREEMSGQLGQSQRALLERLDWLRESVEERLDVVRGTVEDQLRHLTDDNGKRLEQMRLTVDEKLQGTLEKRLGESFALVGERLEQVQRGLGEMQALSQGVGDLRRLLGNVKTRGGWGEVQLGALLEEMFTPAQLVRNFRPTGSGEHVEFALRMPGHGAEPLHLPIDAKFPIEDYDRLRRAEEAADQVGMEQARRALEVRIKACARDIAEKYIVPPTTTDFALLYLPTEGLYGEVLRRDGLLDDVQRKFRVVIVGPTNLSALLSSLQLGFRTLAVEQRSGEVMKLLASVKSEVDRFGDVLAKVKEKLGQTHKTIEDAETRTRVLGRHLRHVEDPGATLALHASGALQEVD